MLQLADSGFPAGTFAHSFGFEALRQLGLLGQADADVERALRELAWHTGTSALPFFGAAFETPTRAAEVDGRNDVYLSNHVARRASVAQGRAFLLAAEAMLEGQPARAPVSALREALPHGHVAVAMGASLGAMGLPRADAREVFLFGAVRSGCSALVRLGALGPLKAQRLLYGLAGTLAEVLRATDALTPADAASVAPLLELAQAAHDRLYSRLFQS